MNVLNDLVDALHATAARPTDVIKARSRLRYDDNPLKAPKWESVRGGNHAAAVAFDPQGRFLACGKIDGEASSH